MPKESRSVHTGTIVTNAAELTIDQLCSTCGLSRDKIVTYVAEGIIEPKGDTTVEWRFSETTIVEVHRAKRLEQDLGLNEAGLALAIDLLSQIDDLKRKLARFEQEDQKRFPTDVL